MLWRKSERHAGRREFRELVERGQGWAVRGLAVHQDQRQPHAVTAAQRQRLADDELQERATLASFEQRLGLLQAHRGRQAAVELDHRQALERRPGVDLGQCCELGHVGRRLELGARDHRRGATADALDRRGELADRGLALAGVAHLRSGGQRPPHRSSAAPPLSNSSSQVVALPSLGRAPVAAGRQRATGADLRCVRDRRALELAGLEEAVQEDPQPMLDLLEAVLVAALGRDQIGPGAALAVAPGLRARARRPCSAGCRSAARGTGRSPAARTVRRCARCSDAGVRRYRSAGISSGEIAVSSTARGCARRQRRTGRCRPPSAAGTGSVSWAPRR